MNRTKLWPWAVVVAVAGITLFFGLALRGIRIEGGMIFLPPDSPVEQQIAAMQREFGSSELIAVMMERKEGSVFTPESLGLIRRITAELERVPGVEEVRSLSNSEYLQGRAGGIVIDPLLPDGPISPGVAAEVRRRALSWELYRGFFFSNDMKSTEWIVTLASASPSSGSHAGAVAAIRNVVNPYEGPNQHFMISGEVAVKALLVSGIARDLTILLPILVVVLVGILFMAFRKPSGVLLPLATVVVSTIWTMGLMSLIGVPINIMGTAIPLLLVTVGSAYGIHFLSHYYEEAGNQLPGAPGMDGRRARADGGSGTELVRTTIRRVGLPILLAGVTTIAGFGSLGSASVPAIFQMGIFTAVGILCALLLTFSFVPAVLTLLHRRRAATVRLPASDRGDNHRGDGAAAAHPRAAHRATTARFLTAVYDLFAKRPLLLLGLVVALVGVSVVGISRIQVGQPTVNFFRPSSPIRAASRFADEHFGGATIMYVIVRPSGAHGSTTHAGSGGTAHSGASGEQTGGAGTGASSAPVAPGASADPFASFGDLASMAPKAGTPEPAGPSVVDPQTLLAVQDLARHLEASYPKGVGRVSSLVTMVKQMNRVMHDGRESYYEIPADPQKYGAPGSAALKRLISQYLLLYSGNLSSFVNSTDNPTALRLAVQLTDSNPSFLREIKRAVIAYGDDHLRPLGFSVTTVGLPDEMLAMNSSIMRSQVTSLSIALLCVFLAMWIAFRSIRIGLAGLLPIAFSLLINFAAMGFLHIPLDIVTAIIASVAIGIGIDYSIHVVSAYVYEYRLTRSTEAAAHATLSLTGRAIFYNVASVTVGFAVLIFSMFTPLNSVGILLGVIMITSSFFSLTLLPIVLRSLVPRLSTGRRTRALEAVAAEPQQPTSTRRNP